MVSNVSEFFNYEIIDLEKEVFKGVYVKDVLESAVKGSLNSLLVKVKSMGSNHSALRIPEVSNALEEKAVFVVSEPQRSVVPVVQHEDNLELMEVDQVLLEYALCEQLEAENKN